MLGTGFYVHMPGSVRYMQKNWFVEDWLSAREKKGPFLLALGLHWVQPSHLQRWDWWQVGLELGSPPASPPSEREAWPQQ